MIIYGKLCIFIRRSSLNVCKWHSVTKWLTQYSSASLHPFTYIVHTMYNVHIGCQKVSITLVIYISWQYILGLGFFYKKKYGESCLMYRKILVWLWFNFVVEFKKYLFFHFDGEIFLSGRRNVFQTQSLWLLNKLLFNAWFDKWLIRTNCI